MKKKIEKLGVDGVIPKPFRLGDFDKLIKYASKLIIDDITLWSFEDSESR